MVIDQSLSGKVIADPATIQSSRECHALVFMICRKKKENANAGDNYRCTGDSVATGNGFFVHARRTHPSTARRGNHHGVIEGNPGP